MTPTKLKVYASLILIVGFILTSSLVILIPVLKGAPTEEYIKLLQAYWSLYSGVIGVIIGYYFGNRSNS